MATMGAEILELRRQLGVMTEETNNLARTMADTTQTMQDMSVTINAQSDMGRGIANLANNSNELSRQAVQDLSTIINFMEERIRAAEAGIAESSGSLSSIVSEMNNVQY